MSGNITAVQTGSGWDVDQTGTANLQGDLQPDGSIKLDAKGSAAVAAALLSMAAKTSTINALGMAESKVQQAFSSALALRGQASLPTLPEVQPAKTQTGNVYYVDQVAGLDTNNGTSEATPWKNLTKLNSLNPGNGATIYLAADSYWDYADTLATYTAQTTFPYNGADSLKSSSASAPVIIRPYYPRPATSLPTVRWYCNTVAGNWTNETGIGPNVWSVPFAVSTGAGDMAVFFGSTETPGTTVLGQTNPALMTKNGQFAKDASKLYVYSSGGNPVSAYGAVKFTTAKYAVFSSFWQGLGGLKIFGMRAELCRLATFNPNSTAASLPLEVAYCQSNKGWLVSVANQTTAAQSAVVNVHDNVGTNTLSKWIHFRTVNTAGGGNDGNTLSWLVYRNAVYVGNVNCAVGGGLLYNQSVGGTNHHAWGNYGYQCLNGSGGETIDGCAIYHDLTSANAVTYGNIAEQCAVGYQTNNSLNNHVIANLAIDCLMFGEFTSSTDGSSVGGQQKNVLHNTYLWTGRVAASSIQSGAGVSASNAVFAFWNDSYASNLWSYLNCLNNVAVCVDGSQAGRNMISYLSNQITTLALGGNAACGLGTNGAGLVWNGHTSTDVTATSGMSVVAPYTAASNWLADPANGNARLAVNSPLIGAGQPLSQQYYDIAGTAFASIPSVGCVELSSTL